MRFASLQGAFAGMAGDKRFWEVIKACSDEAEKARRKYFTFDDWDWIFRTAQYCFSEGEGFPSLMQPALARKRRAIEKARAMGMTAEQLWRSEEAAEAAERAEPVSEPRSSRSRRRLEVAEERA